MAITGCDFVCKNEECKYKRCGIVLTSPWPLGDIDKIINSQKVAKNPPFKKELENRKSQGRKYACIGLPNSEKIPVVGYRINMWCEKCPGPKNYDAIIPENVTGDIIQEAIKNANIPENCPTCNTKLKTFGELIDDNGDGVQCTSCHHKLQNNVWFANEEGEEEKLNPLIKIPKE